MLGNTPVYLPIDRLQVGDVVVSRNECSGATEHKTLVGRSQSKPLCRTAKPTAICCSTRKAALPAQSLRPTRMLCAGCIFCPGAKRTWLEETI